MGCSVSGDTLQHRLEKSLSHRCTWQVTQLFTYLLMQSRTPCNAHMAISVCLLLRHDSAEHRRQRSPKFVFFRALIATNCTSLTKTRPRETSLRCRLVPEMIHIARHCAVWAAPLSQTSIKSTHFQFFWGPVKTRRWNSEIFQQLTHAHVCMSKMLIIRTG